VPSSSSNRLCLSAPDTSERYYVVNVFNMWQELEHYIGRRTTGTKAARYVLVPPGWSGPVPTDATRLDVTTNKVWLWGRLRIAQGEPAEPVHNLQTQFTLTPASGKMKSPELPPLPSTAGDDLRFFKELAFALKSTAIKPADEALFAQFARMGLTKDGFDESKLSPEMKRGVLRALAGGPAVVVSSFASTSSVRNGWNWVTGLDNFGFNYPLRAMIAGPYLRGNGEREAMYPIRYTDSDGQVLNGSNKYVVKMDKEPPVGGHPGLEKGSRWVSDDCGSKRSAGSVHRCELAARTQRRFLRHSPHDQPSDAILDGTYQLPQMTRVK
jgi:hypothetical protein